MPAVTFGGLASGLDTGAMVRAILDAERQPLVRLQDRRSLFSERKASLGELRGKLQEFESALRGLSNSRTFRSRETTVSDEGILRATSSAGAELGLFQVEVNALAAASKVKSDGFSAANQALVADGTITLQSGSQDPITIEVSAASGNNSLQQIRDEINGADAGVQASILFDGSSHRLIVRSEQTGLDNALTISDTTDLNLAGVGNVVTSAANANLVIDGIAVTSGENRISGVIPGVVLDLIGVSTGAVSIEIAQDNDKIVESTQELVSAYNEIIKFFGSQFDRDNPGPLSGDPTSLRVQGQIQSLFTGGVDGIPFGGIRSLSSIGVSFEGGTGEASLDTSVLRDRLDTNFEAVGNLFLTSATTSAPQIQYLASLTDTVPGTYSVEITQAAEQARVQGSTAIKTLNADETLTVGDGSTSVDVLLSSGQQITEVVDTLNAAFSAQGINVTAIDSEGVLEFVSRGYGTNATVSVVSSRDSPANGKGSGFSTTELLEAGVDVAGRIGGVDAVGIGQMLTGAEGHDFAGLQLRVSVTASGLISNGSDFGTASFSKGLIPTALSAVSNLTRLGDGPVDLAGQSLDGRIDRINDDILRLEERLTLREVRLNLIFAEAERAIQALNSQQNSLSGFGF